MRRPVLLLLLVLAALGALAAWWLGQDGPRIAPGDRPDAEQARPDESLPAPADATNPASRREQPADPEDPRARGTSRDPDAPITIHGTVDLWSDVTADAPLPPPSGTFELTIIDGKNARREAVTVTNGRFRSEAPRGSFLEASTFELDGRKAFRNGDLRRELPDDGRVAINAVLLNEVLLHVIDAASGAELRDVVVVAASAPREHPGVVVAGDLLVERRASPFPVGPFVTRDPARGPPRIDESSDVWIGAPDHAWSRARLDFSAKGEREPRVALARGGTLIVEPRSSRPIETAVAARLRLRLESANGGRAFVDVPFAASSPTKVEDLAPGSFALDVGLEPLAGQEAESWSRAMVEITAGAITRLTIDLTAPDRTTQLLPIGGTIEIDAAWGAVASEMVLAPVDDAAPGEPSDEQTLWLSTMKRERDAPLTLRFAATARRPGRWRAVVPALGLEQEFEVGPAGISDLRLVAPPPGELRIAFVDARTQQPVTPVEFRWTVGPAGERSSWIVAQVPQGSTSASLPVPVGPLVIWADREGYSPCTDRFDVQPGVNERRIDLDLPVGLRVTFEVAGAPVEIATDDCPVHARALDVETTPDAGAPRLIQWTHSWQVYELFLSHPGRWEVRFDDLPGYEPVLPFEVKLERGSLQPLTIELRRRD